MNQLWKKIGKCWNNRECLMPIYEVFTDLPDFDLIDDLDYIKRMFSKYCIEIGIKDLKENDVLLFEVRGKRHFGLYDRNGLFFHITKKDKLKIAKLSNYKKYLLSCYRKI